LVWVDAPLLSGPAPPGAVEVELIESVSVEMVVVVWVDDSLLSGPAPPEALEVEMIESVSVKVVVIVLSTYAAVVVVVEVLACMTEINEVKKLLFFQKIESICLNTCFLISITFITYQT